MTLTKAIEAAREAYNKIKTQFIYAPNFGDENIYCSDIVGSDTVDALAALPAKPMTEDEIENICWDYYNKNALSPPTFKMAIRALKSANVLYCEE